MTSVWVLVLMALGCSDARRPLPTASAFDPAAAGTIRGRVTWEGEIPAVPPFKARSSLLPAEAVSDRLIRENPNVPAIDSRTRGVTGAVVFLRGVDAKRARPWDHLPVRVEQRGVRLHVHQGSMDSHFGFVRRGDPVEMISKDNLLHSLHAGGASFFTLAFPDPDQPCTRCLNDKGIVELSSAAGYYWMRAYLFVDDHPYYTRTDSEGNFALQQVPPGRYEVVCWLPNWIESRHEREAETGVIWRLFFRLPVERPQAVNVKSQETIDVQLSMSAKAFQCQAPDASWPANLSAAGQSAMIRESATGGSP